MTCSVFLSFALIGSVSSAVEDITHTSSILDHDDTIVEPPELALLEQDASENLTHEERGHIAYNTCKECFGYSEKLPLTEQTVTGWTKVKFYEDDAKEAAGNIFCYDRFLMNYECIDFTKSYTRVLGKTSCSMFQKSIAGKNAFESCVLVA